MMRTSKNRRFDIAGCEKPPLRTGHKSKGVIKWWVFRSALNIFYIAGKDLRQTGIITAGLILLFITLTILSNYLSAVIITAAAVLLSGAYVMTALLTVERYEDKYNGYTYLLRMPVLPVELAAGKLISIYLMNVLGCGLVIALVRLSGTDSRTIPVSDSITLMAGCVWLLMIVLSYSGICLLGYTKFLFVFRIVIMSLLVAVQAMGVLVFKIGKDLPVLLSRVGGGLAGVPWLPVCLLVSVAYFAYIFLCGGLVRRHAAR